MDRTCDLERAGRCRFTAHGIPHLSAVEVLAVSPSADHQDPAVGQEGGGVGPTAPREVAAYAELLGRRVPDLGRGKRFEVGALTTDDEDAAVR